MRAVRVRHQLAGSDLDFAIDRRSSRRQVARPHACTYARTLANQLDSAANGDDRQSCWLAFR